MDRRLLLLTAFVGGMTTLGIELAASRLLGNVFGTRNLVWANIIGLILVNRTFSASLTKSARQPNLTLLVVVAIVAVVLAATQWAPVVTNVFRFSRIDGADLVAVALSGAATTALLALIKPVWRNRLIA